MGNQGRRARGDEIHSKPLSGQPTGTTTGARLICVLALALVWLGARPLAPASAVACTNAALRSGPSQHLPDCRVYEQVSPVEKGGVDAVTLTPLSAAQSSACEPGETCAIAYMSVTGAFAGALGNEFPNAYVATRGPGGWQNTALTPPASQPPVNGSAKIGYAFSPDLSQTVLRVPLQRLTANAPAGVYNLYVRSADGRYSLVTAVQPPAAPESGCGSCFVFEDVPAFAGASGDFGHVLFEANDSLVAGAPGGGVDNLYEAVGEQVRLVGILPDGSVAAGGATAGGGIEPIEETTGELDHVISQDGSHVLFQAVADSGEPDPSQAGKTELYDRIDGSSTVEVSAPALGAQPDECDTEGHLCEAGAAKFWAASADGSGVVFTSKAALTPRSFTGPEAPSSEDQGNDLYLYDVVTGTLSDLTSDRANPSDPDGADVLGVVGVSEDASYVYFVADGHLAGNAPSGQPNLYVWHGTVEGVGTIGYIATLQAGEEGSADSLDWTEHPSESQAYVTPDGSHLAFMSVKPLTGYDNEDQASTAEHRILDHEVFEYGVGTGLTCVSCDPNGARPVGGAFIGAGLSGRGVSSPFHRPRSLSDDGARVFFSSPDPLVAGLSDGAVKVFEYENGVIELISGTGEQGSDVFLDASASGDDVFFATREQLVASDRDELIDVYDARVDGGLPAPPVQPPPCQDGACQGIPASPPVLSAPISATFAGSGNLAPTQASKPKLTRARSLARALAVCERLRNRQRRESCIRSARRRYAPRSGRSDRASRRRSAG